MSEIQKIDDYNVNLRLLMEQYKDKEKLKGVLEAINAQADDLETALFEIRDLFWIDTAEGVQLDTIGKIFGVAREGRNDTDYRNAIKVRASLIASGEPEAIISALKSLFGGTFVIFIPSYPAIPAGYYVITDATVTLPELIKFSPAGVQPYIGIYLVLENGNNLVFESGAKIFTVS